MTGTKLAIGFVAALIVMFAVLHIHDELHNHSPQGQYEECVRDQSGLAPDATGIQLQQACEQKTGYTP